MKIYEVQLSSGDPRTRYTIHMETTEFLRVYLNRTSVLEVGLSELVNVKGDFLADLRSDGHDEVTIIHSVRLVDDGPEPKKKRGRPAASK